MSNVSNPTLVYEELLARHQAQVLRVCRAVLRDEHRGRDAAQDTFVRLWEKVQQPQAAPDHWDAWLRRVAVRCAVDHSRREKSGPQAIDTVEGRAAVQPTPLEQASIEELESALEAALRRLPEGQRTVFVLRHSAGLPLGEIADCLKLAVPTVKTHFARACLRLQAALRSHREDEA